MNACIPFKSKFLPRLSDGYTAIADWSNPKSLLSDWSVMPVGGTIMIQLQRTPNELEIQMGRGEKICFISRSSMCI